MSKQFLVVGSPIDHSKSPAIHRAAYAVLGLDWDYGRLEVAKNDLRQVLDNAPEALCGFSVTAPLKEEASRHAIWRDEFAEVSGAANTLVRVEGGWNAYNTDVFGIVQALRGIQVQNLERVVIIGSGATAKSAVLAVRLLNTDAKLLLVARNKETRKELLAFCKDLGLNAKGIRSLAAGITKADLTISTIPAHALDSEIENLSVRKTAGIKGPLLDVAYNPWPSVAAQAWGYANQPVASGLDMLIWQAVAQLRIFTTGNPNQELPNEVAVLEAMRHAV